jgi:hypothetical protein
MNLRTQQWASRGPGHENQTDQAHDVWPCGISVAPSAGLTRPLPRPLDQKDCLWHKTRLLWALAPLRAGEMVLPDPPLPSFSSLSIQGFLPRMPDVMNILLSVSSGQSSAFLLLKSFHQDCARVKIRPDYGLFLPLLDRPLAPRMDCERDSGRVQLSPQAERGNTSFSRPVRANRAVPGSRSYT